MSDTMRKAILIVVGIIVLITLVMVVVVLGTSTSSGATTKEVKPADCRGHHHKCGRITLRSEGEKPILLTDRRTTAGGCDTATTCGGLTLQQDPTTLNGGYEREAGCDNSRASGAGYFAGIKLWEAKMWQYFCWAHGHIYRVDRLKKQVSFTTAGEASPWQFDGWRDGPNGWTNYDGKYHGGHFVNKTAKFRGCINVLFGCVTLRTIGVRLSILQHAGGRWWGNATFE